MTPASAASAVSAGRLATLLVSAPTSGPGYLALAHRLRELVGDGRLPVGTRLPSERALAAALGRGRATVTRAYDVLREQAYLESRQGSGSITRLPVSHAGRTDHLLVPRGSTEDSIDLTIATLPAPPGTADAYRAAVEELPAYLLGTGYYPTGLPALREAVADRYTRRGLATSPAQVVVVAGALAGLAVTAQVLTRPGDRVLVESPTYPNPLSTLQARGVRLVATAVDPGHGWDVDAVRQLVRAPRMRAAYLIPDFHNPTGALMPTEVRHELARVLAAAGVTPVVDESMVDLALDDAPLPAPFAAHSPGAFSIGSASKAFWGGLRIGWVRAPADRVDAVAAARLSLDLASPLLEQLTLLEMLRDEGPIRRHHRERVTASRAALLGALARELPDWRSVPGRGGLSLWCRLPAPLSSALSVAAERHGLYLAAGPSFAPEGGLERHVRLPHTLPGPLLEEAVRRLARAWADAPAVARRGAGGTSGRSPVVA